MCPLNSLKYLLVVLQPLHQLETHTHSVLGSLVITETTKCCTHHLVRLSVPVSISSVKRFLPQAGQSFPVKVAYPILGSPEATFYTLSSAFCLWHCKHTHITVTMVTDADGSCDACSKPYKKSCGQTSPRCDDSVKSDYLCWRTLTRLLFFISRCQKGKGITPYHTQRWRTD